MSESGWYDWSDLPQEIMALIFDCRKLDPIDILRCRIVCKSWLSASSQVYQKYFPLCLIRRVGEEEGYNSHKLFSISTQEHGDERRKIQLPEGQRICCWSNGWLLTVEIDASPYPQLRLLNLFSRAQILLPPANTLVHHRSLGYEWSAATYIQKAIVVSTSDDDLIILIHYCDRTEVAFCKPSDERWTCFKPRSDFFGQCFMGYGYDYVDVIFYKNQFYGLLRWGSMVVFQLSPEPKEINFRVTCWTPCPYDFMYLVESAVDGELLVVSFSQFNFDAPPEKVIDFEVGRLDLTRKVWVKVEDDYLRGQALLLCDGFCVSIPTAAANSTSNNIFRGNRIIFEHIASCHFSMMLMHDLGTAQTELLYQHSNTKELVSIHW
ncbi:hypothetical protein COLO4_13839 [Corchorus olitorius]|uniref:F-box domain-containing protein n=1 Tax=Corchorus olitorius TaxID=93759 RepID=A0A1R3JUC8_9ROSI|nr:hypothetical protein COLO4_13839 [Corchorus olitorius]